MLSEEMKNLKIEMKRKIKSYDYKLGIDEYYKNILPKVEQLEKEKQELINKLKEIYNESCEECKEYEYCKIENCFTCAYKEEIKELIGNRNENI